jgi:hypothetical protein
MRKKYLCQSSRCDFLVAMGMLIRVIFFSAVPARLVSILVLIIGASGMASPIKMYYPEEYRCQDD